MDDEIMEQEKKNWFLQWLDKPWIRATAIVLVVSMLIGLVGHGLYLRKVNREYEKQEAARLEQEQKEQKRKEDFDADYAKVRDAIADKDYAAALNYLDQCMEYAEPGSDVETELLTTRASLNILLGDNQQALDDLDRASEAAPDSPVILLLKSQTELGMEDLEMAQKDMEKYLEVEPDSYDVRLSLTQLYESTGQYSAAADSYGELQKLRPGDDSIAINISRCLILAQRFTEAEEILESFIRDESSEQKGIAHFLQAMIRMQDSDFSGAIEDYTAAIEGGYDTRLCLEQIAACAFVLGDHKLVLECEQRYHELWPEGSSAASFYQQIGVSAMSLKDYSHAEECLTRALELDPEYPGGHYYRGLTRFADSQWQPAAEDFTQAIEREYMTQNALYNRGLCYAKLNDMEKACADLQKASQGEDREIREAAEVLLPAIQQLLDETAEK